MTDINGFSGESITLNGLVTDNTTTSEIDLTNNDINLIADNIFVNGANIQDVIDKTENINNVTTGITNVIGILNVGAPILSNIQYPLTTTTLNQFVAANNSSFGFKFTLINTIKIYRLALPSNAWQISNTNSSQIKIYNEGNATPIYSYLLTKSILSSGFYILDITPIVLPIGTYRFSVGLNIGQNYYNAIALPMTFNTSFITNVQASSSVSIDGAYPNVLSGILNSIFSGFFYYEGIENKIKSEIIETPQIQSSTGNISINNTLDLKTNTIVNVSSINGLSPIGGVWMSTNDGLAISGTITETSILNSVTSIGSLSIPSNAFTISSYKLVLSGDFKSVNNDTITIKLKSGSVILGQITPILVATVAGESFQLIAYFSIKVLGIATTANICTNFEFSYSNGVADMRADRSTTTNNTTFSTTTSNTLDITTQWSSTSINNSIKLIQGILTKIY